MGGARSTYNEEERFIQGVVGNTERKRPFRISMRRWEDDIKMDLQGVGWETWTDLTLNLDRWWEFVSPAMNLRFP
jgi:hypothetical protein